MSLGVYALIDLAALQHNLQVVRQQAPNSKVLAVLKSQGYGHGALPVAQALQAQADALGVARVEEALALRQAGISADIVVLEGPLHASDIDSAQRQDLILTIHHPHQLELLKQANPKPKLRCWLKLDTGMHRLGFVPEQVASLLAELKAIAAVADDVVLMTHLANADDTADPASGHQLQRMQAATSDLALPQSIANSAGILAWPDSHKDWVRPGLMLYGASPLIGKSADDLGLCPVMTLKAPLIAINALKKGEPVGYGGTWQADRDMRLGVVGIGYGDGYPRHIGPQGQVLLHGQRLPVIGRVSMDMIAIDLQDCDAEIGDGVTLWGGDLPLDEVAAWANTIPYTLICGLTARVPRIYAEQEA